MDSENKVTECCPCYVKDGEPVHLFSCRNGHAPCGIVAQLTQLRAENEYFKSERDALDESRIAFVKEAYKLLNIEDDGEYRWKWVLLGIHNLKTERNKAEAFARDIANNYDCDTGANNSHPSYCRSCTAKAFLASL